MLMWEATDKKSAEYLVLGKWFIKTKTISSDFIYNSVNLNSSSFFLSAHQSGLSAIKRENHCF